MVEMKVDDRINSDHFPVIRWIEEKGEKRRVRKGGERRGYWRWTLKGKKEFKKTMEQM